MFSKFLIPVLVAAVLLMIVNFPIKRMSGIHHITYSKYGQYLSI